MKITATHLAYWVVCKRKLWLFHHQISMEQTSDTVYEGRLIGETTYEDRAEKHTEVQLSATLPHEPEAIHLLVKIDYYDPKTKVVHEVKKSNKLEEAHIAQLKLYLYVLAQNGMADCSGLLDYPKLRQTHSVPPLSEDEKTEIENWLRDISKILAQENCPPLVKKTYCKSCSYFDFCFVD
jgi:CRISPR-associated exonuclease Cas4